MKKIIFSIIIASFCFVNSTCKKISKNPFNMYGIWVTNDSFCKDFIEISLDGFGHYGTKSLDKGCRGDKWKGKVKYNNKHLYIGYTTFKILHKPEIYNGNDSIYWDDLNKGMNYKKLSVMKLETSFFHGKQEQVYYKIINY